MSPKELSYDDFRKMAADPKLSPYEKTGFGDSYRKGRELDVFHDIIAALPILNEKGKTVIDIGPGCADVPRYMIEHCERQAHRLVLIDCAEMLALLPEAAHVEKSAGRFPADGLADKYRESADAVVIYSVLQTIYGNGCIFDFFDSALALLKPGGQLLIGDIPNVTMRKRTFSSEAGKKYHRAFTGKDEDPEVQFNQLEHDKIDDAVIFGLLLRARAAGFHSYVRAQAVNLPFANRREDIVIVRP